MNTIVIEHVDNKTATLLVELIKKLGLTVKTQKETDAKTATLNTIKQGFEEMKLIKQGKLKTTSLNDFLNEL
jgi:predicted metal-dependent TIM-barrel fold hydrolase